MEGGRKGKREREGEGEEISWPLNGPEILESQSPYQSF